MRDLEREREREFSGGVFRRERERGENWNWCIYKFTTGPEGNGRGEAGAYIPATV